MLRPLIRLRGASGLGDSIYVQSIARYFVQEGHPVEVCSDWPDVFRTLPADRVSISRFRREHIDRLATYAMRRNDATTDQFQDCCIQARVPAQISLRLDWEIVNHGLVAKLRKHAGGRPIIFVQLPRSPMGRTDGYGAELLPDCTKIQQIIDRIGSRACFVQVGKGEPLYKFTGIDFNVANQTGLTDAIDIASVSDGFLGYVSFIVPLAEALNKPLLAVWSRRGVESAVQVIKNITPSKIFHHSTSRHVFDDAGADGLNEAADAFCRKI